MHGESVRARRLGGAIALLALAWLAAPSARAQDGNLEPGDPGELACGLYAELIDIGNEFCTEQGCAPETKDCKKFCKSVSQACQATGKSTAKAFQDGVKGVIKGLREFCQTADDKKACKSDVKQGDKILKDELKSFKKGIKDACKAEALKTECEDACGTTQMCGCDGDALFCSVPG